MGSVATENIRNVVLLGHGGCGKTTLVEAMAYATGVTGRIKKVDEGGTISDYDKEEISRKFSINTSIVPITWEGIKMNILDTPGFFDFSGEVFEALSVADGAIIVVSGKNGIEVGTVKAFEYCKQFNIPAMVFVTDMDDPHANYMNVVNDLKERYGKKIAPFHLPVREDGEFVGFVNVVKMAGRKFHKDGTYEDYDVPGEYLDDLNPCREMILEAVAETSEELMNKYFDGIEFTQQEVSLALRGNVSDGTIVPVLMGCGLDLKGVRMLLMAIDKYFDQPKPKSDNPLSLYIFKTIVDPFIGKYSLFRVCSGNVKQGVTLYNPDTDSEEKISKLYTMCGSKPIEVSELSCGDIGAVAKLSGAKTGHTLCLREKPITYDKAYIPKPYTFTAYVAANKGDEDKISSALHKLMDEDLTLKEENDKANGQLLLYGIGDQQLEVVASKLFNRYKVQIELKKPRIAYKETILKKVEALGRHKKQSGGHGQFGDVKMTFEPSGDLNTPYVFEEKVFGGAVPRNFFPAVEKGVMESCLKGPLGGYPVVGIKATLIDGSYHPVDSSEMAFKMASQAAFKSGIMEAQPILLEPIMTIKVTVPDDFTGDVMGDLNKRRGKVLGMNPVDGGKQTIEAYIPMGSIYGYSTVLRSMTGGAGEYEYEFARYEQMPKDAQDKVLKES